MENEEKRKQTPPPQDNGTVTIPSRVFRCVTRGGFINEFWDVLAAWSERSNVTQYEVFEYLNEEYKKVFGEYAFNTFDAFRVFRDRLYMKISRATP